LRPWQTGQPLPSSPVPFPWRNFSLLYGARHMCMCSESRERDGNARQSFRSHHAPSTLVSWTPALASMGAARIVAVAIATSADLATSTTMFFSANVSWHIERAVRRAAGALATDKISTVPIRHRETPSRSHPSIKGCGHNDVDEVWTYAAALPGQPPWPSSGPSTRRESGQNWPSA